MTSEPTTNGRVTQRDLYDAITRLDIKLDRHYSTLDHRLRDVERAVIEEQAHDDERELMLREQRAIKQEQGISRRWLVGIAVTVLLSFAASLTSILLAVSTQSA